MPFEIKPVPAPQETYIDAANATADDRLLVELENGHSAVFEVDPTHHVITCDLFLTSRELVQEICNAVIKRQDYETVSLPFLRKKLFDVPTVRERVVVVISGGLLRPKLTVGDTLRVDAGVPGVEIRYFPLGNGSKIKSISSYVPTKIIIVE